MKTYYAVVSTYYDSGRVTALHAETVQACKAPANKRQSLRDRDIYTEWFESYSLMREYIKSTLKLFR